jgi:Transcriptional regulators
MVRDILISIEQNMSSFSKGQRQIGRYILDNYDKAAFMTASKLGKTVSVSESTVVRFASELGYDGYPGMQKALQDMIRNKLTSIQRFEVSEDRIGTGDVLDKVMHADIEKIRMTMEEIDRLDFTASVDAISKANRIYIVGARSAMTIAGFLAFYFNMIFDNVTHVQTSSMTDMFESMFRMKEGDVLIAASFPRYSKRTVRAARFARDRGAAVIAITDSESSPLAPLAHYRLIAKSDMASFVDSLVAPLSLCNALIVALGRKKPKEVSENFEFLEQVWSDYEIYGVSDEN